MYLTNSITGFHYKHQKTNDNDDDDAMMITVFIHWGKRKRHDVTDDKKGKMGNYGIRKVRTDSLNERDDFSMLRWTVSFQTTERVIKAACLPLKA